MKIYVTHSSRFDYKNELYHPLRKSKLNSLYEITLPHEHSLDPYDSKEYMKRCDLIISEVSYPSTGQGIELGWANTHGVPIICIYKKGSKPSGSLKVVSEEFIEYKNVDDMIKKLEDYLASSQEHEK